MKAMDEQTFIREEMLGLLLEKWKNNGDCMSAEKFNKFIDYKLRMQEFQDRLIRRICMYENIVSKRVLDAGSGEGGLVVALNLRGCMAAGADIKEDNIRISKLRARLEGLPENIFIHCDASGLPFEDGFFDMVIMNEVLEHVADVQATMKEVARVLKEGGLFFARVPNALWPFEGHVNLWFPHWLPSPLRRSYVRLFRPRKGYESCFLDDIRYHDHRGWKREVAPFFRQMLSNEILYENLMEGLISGLMGEPVAGRQGLFRRCASRGLDLIRESGVMDVLSPTTYLVARK